MGWIDCDFNFGKKDGPEEQYRKWLADRLKDIHDDIALQAELIQKLSDMHSELNTDHKIHVATQIEQWKLGCSPVQKIDKSLSWIKTVSVTAWLMSLVSLFWHWWRR